MNYLKHCFFILLGFFLVQNFTWAKPADELEILRQKFRDEQLTQAVSEDRVMKLLSTLKLDGTWPDIDYKDVSRTGFQHGQHLSNMVEMARAYEKKGSKLKGNKNLKRAINLSLDYWLANDFICENWWWNQIGTPNALVSFLLMMDKDLTPVQIEKTLAIVGRANMNASGARPSGDRIKIAGILAKASLYSRNKQVFDETIRIIEGEIKFSTERGMQYDYSFHHREDWVNNTLSYGTGYADAFAEWAANVAGTRYQFSEKSMHHLIDYYLDGICKQMVFGKQTDPGVMNRDITRGGESHIWGTATPERLLQAASGYRKAELEDIIKIRKGEARPGLSYAKFFWNTEHFVIQRPDYFTSVRMFSTRNRNMEEPYNGEGLMNHHRADGTNYISRTGKEYSDIAPVNDWQKIPGATVVQKAALPSENEIQKDGLTDFVGAVTDGMYGAVAFDFRSPHDPLVAKKSWFFFDNEYVCLGAGITASTSNPVATTLNQSWLNGGVTVMNGEKQAMSKGERSLENVKWVYHDGIGYLFLNPARVMLSNQLASGSWFKVNRQSDSPRDEIRGDVFKLWIDHGKRPRNASYEYIVLPSTGEAELAAKASNCPVEIIANTVHMQAVRHNGLNISEAVFYKAGELQVTGDIKVGIDSPGVILVKTDGRNISSVSVADPSRKLNRIHLTVNRKITATGDHFKANWDEAKGTSEITIDLPQSAYAGKSVTVNL